MNPYEILGIDRGAGEKEIAKAYRSLSRKHHPDMHVNAEDAEKHAQKFKEISAAYEILSNPSKKNQYDQFGTTEQPQGHPFRGNPFRGNPFGGSFFDSMFNQNRAAHGEHIVVECNIDLIDVLNGCKKEIKYDTKVVCKSCNGKRKACSECKGTGKKIIFGEHMTVQIPCEVCQGEGEMASESCKDCEDGLVKGESKTINFDVPQGVETGMRFSYRGSGCPSTHSGGHPGNLYVVMTVNDHSFLQRDGRFLQCEIELTYTQMVLGDEVDVPTLEGRAKLKIPAGTTPNSKFKMEGLGVPGFNKGGRVYKRGDQFVVVHLKMPKDLTDEHRKLIEDLSKLEKGE